MLATLLMTAMVSSSSGPAVFVPPPVYVESPTKIEKKVESRPAKTMPAATTTTTRTITYPTQTPYKDPAGSHRHKCPVDGYVWEHRERDPNASHNCPDCGRQQLNHYTGPLPPTKPSAKPVPKVEFVESFDAPPIQYVLPATFASPKSNCPNGNCPTAQPVRRGLFGWR